jgi:hypothetical protein
VSRFWIPIKLWRLLDTTQEIHITVTDPELGGAVVHEQVFTITTTDPDFESSSLVVAGYTNCILQDCMIKNGTEVGSFAVDYQPGRLSGHPDPVVRQGFPDYPMGFLEKRVPPNTVAENYTDSTTNARIDQTQSAAFSMECDIDAATTCAVTNYLLPPFQPAPSVLKWRRQNRRSEFNPGFVGQPSADKVRVPFIPYYSNDLQAAHGEPLLSAEQLEALANDKTQRRCDPALLIGGQAGSMCKLLETHRILLQRPASELELDSSSVLHWQRRRWNASVQIKIEGTGIVRRTGFPSAFQPVCPSLSQVAVTGSAGADGGSSQDLWFALQNIFNRSIDFVLSVATGDAAAADAAAAAGVGATANASSAGLLKMAASCCFATRRRPHLRLRQQAARLRFMWSRTNSSASSWERSVRCCS